LKLNKLKNESTDIQISYLENENKLTITGIYSKVKEFKDVIFTYLI